MAIRRVATTAGRSAAPADGIDSDSDPPYGDAVSGSREAAAPERIRGPAMWAAVVACGRSRTQRDAAGTDGQRALRDGPTWSRNQAFSGPSCRQPAATRSFAAGLGSSSSGG